MTSRARLWLVRAVRIALTLALTWLILDQVGISLDLDEAGEAAARDVSPLALSASVALLLTGLAASAWAWGAMATELGASPLGLVPSMRIVFSANLGRYLPGKIWQIAGLAVLARREQVPPAVSITAAVLGQCFALVAVAILGAPALARLGQGGGRVDLALGVAFGVAAILLIPGVLAAVVSLAFRLAREPAERMPKVRSLFALKWMAVYLVNWVVYGAAFVMLIRGLGLAGAPLELVAAFAGAYLMGYLAFFAPAGLGVREGFLIAFLDQPMGGAAVGVAVISRVWLTLAELVSAAPFALWEVARTGRGGNAPESSGRA